MLMHDCNVIGKVLEQFEKFATFVEIFSKCRSWHRGIDEFWY